MPTPRARLDLVRAITDAGLPCGVFLAPVLPGLTDGVDHLDAALGAIAAAGATGRHRASRCTCGPAPGSGSWPGWPARTRSWCRATSSCTPGARTCPPSTAPGWPGAWPRCWRGTAWTGRAAAPRAGRRDRRRRPRRRGGRLPGGEPAAGGLPGQHRGADGPGRGAAADAGEQLALL